MVPFRAFNKVSTSIKFCAAMTIFFNYFRASTSFNSNGVGVTHFIIEAGRTDGGFGSFFVLILIVCIIIFLKTYVVDFYFS